MQFSGLGGSKMEFSEIDFFPSLTIQNDQISYVKHVLAPLHVFFTQFGCVWGGGGGKGSRAHNLLMQFSGLGSSKMEISETDFFDTLTIQNDQISYVKHVLDPVHVVFKVLCGAPTRGCTVITEPHLCCSLCSHSAHGDELHAEPATCTPPACCC